MKKKYSAILEHVLTDVKDDLDDEEIIHLLLQRDVAQQPAAKRDNLGVRLADKIAAFAGSWKFISIFCGILLLWMGLNVFLLANKGFDPYPFILLNLVLSCVAAIQAPLIMMSQNRQEEKDRRRSENDYKVNLKTEVILGDLHEKLDYLIAHVDDKNNKAK